jgi:hypothetical protein
MEKWLCLAAVAVGGLMALIFLADLVAGMPFGGGPFQLGDILGLVASAIVIYLGLDAKKTVR